MKIENDMVYLSPKEQEILLLAEHIRREEPAVTAERVAGWASSALPAPDPSFVGWLSTQTLPLVEGIVEGIPGGRP